MAYRDDLTALSARHDALADEVLQKTRELEASRHLLEQAKARAKLPVLDNLRVATPCTADWSQMTGDDRTRHCGDCQKSVYNLSRMTREEAEALVIKNNGDLCVRYYQRHDGTILLADCTIGAGRRRRRRLVTAATLLAGTAAMIGVRTYETRTYMGAVGIVESQPPTVPELPSFAEPPADTAGAHDQVKDTLVPTTPTKPAPHHVKMGKFVRVP
jgi:hypothetical protein